MNEQAFGISLALVQGWMLNNREISAAFWLLLLLTLSRAWGQVGGVVRTLLHPWVLLALGAAGIWIWGEIRVGQILGIWNGDLAKDTAVWGCTSAAALWADSPQATRRAHFFLTTLGKVLGVTFLVGVLTGTYVFSLWIEIPLVPVATLFAIAPLVARTPQNEPFQRIAPFVTMAIGLVIAGHVGLAILREWDTLDRGELLRTVGLPIWLTIGLSPCVYVFGLWATYRTVFRLISWRAEGESGGRRRRWRAKALLLCSFHVRAFDLSHFSVNWSTRLAAAGSVREARLVLKEFARSEAERAEAERRAAIEEEIYQRRLVELAGVDGTDSAGRRLDRREFRETVAALDWLATCHIGWYHHDDRYVSDLVDQVMGPYLPNVHLPSDHGIEAKVSSDGQQWSSWRTTPSGWVFGIGAAGPPLIDGSTTAPKFLGATHRRSGVGGTMPTRSRVPSGRTAPTEWGIAALTS